MQARVKWVEGLTFLGESSSGHQVLMDGNSGDKAPSPMEMVLMAAGGCSAIDVVSILQKGRNDSRREPMRTAILFADRRTASRALREGTTPASGAAHS